MADMTPTNAFAHAPASAAKTTFITAVDTLMTAIDTLATTAATGTSQVYTLAIVGTPTGGTYDVTIEGDTDIAAQTITVAYNISAANLQIALRALTGTGLDQTTVTASGSTPNFTHTITFNEVNKATAACVTVLGTQDTYGHQAETGTDTARETLALTAAGNDSLVIDFAGCKGSSPVGVTAPGTRTLLTSASGTGGSATEVGVGWAPVTAAGTVASVSYTSQSVADGGTISVIVKPLVVQTYP